MHGCLSVVWIRSPRLSLCFLEFLSSGGPHESSGYVWLPCHRAYPFRVSRPRGARSARSSAGARSAEWPKGPNANASRLPGVPGVGFRRVAKWSKKAVELVRCGQFGWTDIHVVLKENPPRWLHSGWECTGRFHLKNCKAQDICDLSGGT